MENREDRSVRERVGLSVRPVEPARIVEKLVKMEEVGVEQVWLPFGPPASSDLLTTLAAAAVRTTHLKLGTAIVQVFARHPVFMAQQVLSLNALAPGRLRLGIGTSSGEFAKRAYGVEMERPLAYLREYVQVLRPLLEEGEVHHRGRYFVTDASLQESSRVPLLIAELGPVAFRLAGEIADGALPALAPIPYLLNTAAPAMKEGAAAAGRESPPVIANVAVAFTEDRASALQAGRRAMAFPTSLPTYRRMYMAAGFTEQEITEVADSLVEGLLVYGDESRIRDRLLELLATEIDELTVSVVPVADVEQEEMRLARLIGRL